MEPESMNMLRLKRIDTGTYPDENPSYSKEMCAGADIVKFTTNSKLLIEAVKVGNETLVTELLNAGVPLYICDQMGCNPFYYAARYNHVNILNILLKAGALINVGTKMGRSALQIAAYHGYLECVKFLIEHSANINLVDSLGMSALHWASENGHLETVKLLLESGADPSLVSKFGKTASALALRKKHMQIYDLLQRHANIDGKRSTEFMLTSNDKNMYRPFTALFIPDKSTVLPSQQTATSIPGISSTEFKPSGDLESKLTSKDDTIKLFEQHGIKLLPVDQSTIIANALQRGQTAVLTEAGKLALKKTEPNIIRKIASMSTRHLQVSQLHQSPKEVKPEERNNESCTTAALKRPYVDVPINKTKIIKIDAKQLVTLAANKKLIISRPNRIVPSTATEKIIQAENVSPNPTEKKPLINTNIDLVDQLQKKSILIRDMKKQLEVSMQLAKHYKTKFEEKEREAALYKTQLSNLSKLLIKSGIRITKW